MKAIFMVGISGLLLCGCRSIHKAEATKTAYPLPAVPLARFFKEPVDGVYSVPKSAASARDLLSHEVIVVSGGDIHLSRIQNAHVSTNDLDFVEFRPALPSEEVLQHVSAEATEDQLHRQFGKPTHQGFDFYPFINVRSRKTKHVTYSWFTVSEKSQITFMLINVGYIRAKNNDWRVESLTWEKWGGQDFSPEE